MDTTILSYLKAELAAEEANCASYDAEEDYEYIVDSKVVQSYLRAAIRKEERRLREAGI